MKLVFGLAVLVLLAAMPGLVPGAGAVQAAGPCNPAIQPCL